MGDAEETKKIKKYKLSKDGLSHKKFKMLMGYTGSISTEGVEGDTVSVDVLVDNLSKTEGFTSGHAIRLLRIRVKKVFRESLVFRYLVYAYSTLIVFSVLTILFIILKIGVVTPGTDVSLSNFVKSDGETPLTEDVLPLAVAEYAVSTPLNIVSIYIKNWEYRDALTITNIDKLNPLNWFGSDEEDILYYPHVNLQFGSSLLDSQMSSFIVLNKMKGIDIEYEQDVRVESVKYPKDYNGLWNIYPDDTIISINGVAIKEPLDLILKRIEFVNTEVTMQIKRGDAEVFVVGEIPDITTVRVIKFKDPEYYTPFNNFAQLYSRNIEGGSAGSSMTLGYYNTYVEDVTKGRKVALSGSINPDGTLTPISGVDLKTIQAMKNGADIIFFANDKYYPRKDGKTVDLDNVSEAQATVKKYGSNLKVVGVDTFEEIVEYLKKN